MDRDSATREGLPFVDLFCLPSEPEPRLRNGDEERVLRVDTEFKVVGDKSSTGTEVDFLPDFAFNVLVVGVSEMKDTGEDDEHCL
jgi:hypothetical protein